jgi:hypothetical protein
VRTLDAQPRSVVIALTLVVLVWANASLALPQTDAGFSARAPVDVRIAPMTVLAAIASDRPATTPAVRRSGHPDAIPAVISVEAGTRSALMQLTDDVPLPASSIATSRLAHGLVRRGPPLSFAT